MTTGTLPASCWACPPSRRRKSSQRQQQQQRPQPAETRWWFTEEELAKIQNQLDKLQPYSNCSSKAISLISALSACLPAAECSHACSRIHIFCAEQTVRHPPTHHPALRRWRGPASGFRGHPGDKTPVNCTYIKPTSKSPACRPNLDGGVFCCVNRAEHQRSRGSI